MFIDKKLLEYYFRLDYEIDRLIDIKFKLTFLKSCGYDVERFIKYINSKIDEVSFLQVETHKISLVMAGQLPSSCFGKCDCNCLECHVQKEMEIFL